MMTEKPPEMQIIFGQVSSVSDAPGAFFTFEGGLGACISRTDPNLIFRSSVGQTRDESRSTNAMMEAIHIGFNVQASAWAGRSIARTPSGQLCVDESMVPDDALVIPAISQFELDYQSKWHMCQCHWHLVLSNVQIV